MPVQLKLDADGHVVLSEGKPVVIHPDGKEAPFDIDHTLNTISRLNGEAQGHREAKEAAEGRLKIFEGIDDPDAARSALATVKSLSVGELKTAEQVQEIQKAAQKAAEEQVRETAAQGARTISNLTKERDALNGQLFNERIGGAFNRSAYVKDKLLVPVDMLQSMFASRFKFEEGRIVGHDASGNKIYSRARAGEIADFDEAMEHIVDSYPNRDSIVRGAGSSGGGARNGAGGVSGANVVTRAEFDKMDPTTQMATIKAGKQVVDAV